MATTKKQTNKKQTSVKQTGEKQTRGAITITPDYSNIVRQFIRDAMIHADVFARETDPKRVEQFRNFIVSLNIAIQAVASNADVLYIRETMNALVERIVKHSKEVGSEDAWGIEVSE